jgi:hypothetical protein
MINRYIRRMMNKLNMYSIDKGKILPIQTLDGCTKPYAAIVLQFDVPNVRREHLSRIKHNRWNGARRNKS